MGKKHFSDNNAAGRGGRKAGGPGSFGSRDTAGRSSDRGSDAGPERRSYSTSRPATGGSYARRSEGGYGAGRSGGQPFEQRDERPRAGKEQRSGTSYGRTERPQAPRETPRDTRPVRDYQPRENWPGQPYRRDGEKTVPRGAPGERNRKFQKQNPFEPRESSAGSVPGFGRSAPREGGYERREAREESRPEERGPNRPIRAARPFEANPPQPREEQPRDDRRRGYPPDDEADRAAFGRKFTPGAFGKREPNFNPRSQGERPGGFGQRGANNEREGRPRRETSDWAGSSNATGKGSFAQRREELKAAEKSIRRSGTGYGRETATPGQANRADKPRYGEKPGEAPDYKNLKHYENDKTRGNKRRQQEDQDFGADEMRLNRYIANAGICSRREADALIAAGEIRVNGEVVTEMGYKVQPEDTVQYGKTNLSREKLVYVLLNKPKDFITTTEDPEGRRTVMDLVSGASKERLFPVGRLDRNTTGLLLFTNDGEVAQKLSHPSHKNKKIYQVELSQPLTAEHLRQIAEGLELEDGKALVDDVAVVAGNPHFVGIEIHIGRNRIVRRIFEHLGYEVVALDRVQYAGLTKKDVPRGKWRFLTEQEVIRLKYFL